MPAQPCFLEPVGGNRFAESAINYLVALTNQAYIDSGFNLRLRVVHTQSVSYTERNSNDTALDALTDAVAQSFG